MLRAQPVFQVRASIATDTASSDRPGISNTITRSAVFPPLSLCMYLFVQLAPCVLLYFLQELRSRQLITCMRSTAASLLALPSCLMVGRLYRKPALFGRLLKTSRRTAPEAVQTRTTRLLLTSRKLQQNNDSGLCHQIILTTQAEQLLLPRSIPGVFCR